MSDCSKEHRELFHEQNLLLITEEGNAGREECICLILSSHILNSKACDTVLLLCPQHQSPGMANYSEEEVPISDDSIKNPKPNHQEKNPNKQKQLTPNQPKLKNKTITGRQTSSFKGKIKSN